MKVSVIIPTYKPQAYLWECLTSLKEQTLPTEQYEVLIVLNGDKEPYYQQIADFISGHNNMHLFYIQTSGVSNARNIGLDNAQGEYVAFVDDDDYVSTTYLEDMCKLATSENIVCSYPYAFHDGHSEVQLKDYYITEAYEYCILHPHNILTSRGRRFFAGPCIKLIPMCIIQDRRFDVHFTNGEDSLFMFLISDKFDNIQFTQRTSVYYRRFRNGSATQNIKMCERMKNSIKLTKAYSHIYWHNPCRYNFIFYLTRIFGGLKNIIA